MRYPVWVNGSEQGCISPGDRGLGYGDGLFETLRVASGKAIFLQEHLSRLEAGAQALGIPLGLDCLQQDVVAFLAQCPESCIAKIILTRGSGGRGYLPDPDAVPTLIFSAHPLPDHTGDHLAEGVRASVCSLRLGAQPALAGFKHLNRLEQVLLRRELAGLQADEALVCDTHGNVVEGVFSNVFMVKEGRLHTPAIDVAGVRGVMRAVILEEAAAQNDAAVQGRYTVDEFAAADEVFFCNSVNGIWPVRTLASRSWLPGPVTRYWQAYWQRCLSSQ